LNLCTACREDFGSVSAFDAHRVGVHEYTFDEGLLLTPPRDNGRRCLSFSELESSLRFSRNTRGTWSLSSQLERAREKPLRARTR